MMLGPDDPAFDDSNEDRWRKSSALKRKVSRGSTVQAITSSATSLPNGKSQRLLHARVRYKEIYPGIDVVYYGSDRHLEYDFGLQALPIRGIIELAYDGADRMQVENNGDLLLQVNGRTLRQLLDLRSSGSERRAPRSGGVLSHSFRNRVEFALADYDRKRELVIDPVLQYSTYLGQEGRDVAIAVATDR